MSEDDPAPSRRSTAVRLGVIGAVAVAFVAGGCGGGGEEDSVAYCVDADDTVVENRYCDDDRHVPVTPFLWYFAGAGAGRLYGAGDRVARSGGTLVRANDGAALARRAGFGATAQRGGSIGRATKVTGGGGARVGG